MKWASLPDWGTVQEDSEEEEEQEKEAQQQEEQVLHQTKHVLSHVCFFWPFSYSAHGHRSDFTYSMMTLNNLFFSHFLAL